MNFPIGLEILPRTRRRSTDDVFETEVAGIPGLLREGWFFVYGVEGTDRGEFDIVVATEHCNVVSELVWVDSSDWDDSYPDHGTGFDADVRLHCFAADEKNDDQWKGWQSLVKIEFTTVRNLRKVFMCNLPNN